MLTILGKSLSKVKNLLRIITLLYFVWIIFGGNSGYLFMLWNVFLAWLPLEFATLSAYIFEKHISIKHSKLLIIIIGFIWLLFYPNSPYIITDFIHLSSNNYYVINPNYTPYSTQPRILFNDEFKVWIDFFNIGIGVWIGYITGFISLVIIHRLVERSFNKVLGWIFVTGVSLLSGFAIYLGRFIRWNSWDIIFKPQNILRILNDDMHSKSLQYTILFGIFILTLYILNYCVAKLQYGGNNEYKNSTND